MLAAMRRVSSRVGGPDYGSTCHVEFEWLPAPKAREYYVDSAVGDTQEAERGLFCLERWPELNNSSAGRGQPYG
jgi:hypothetical protein